MAYHERHRNYILNAEVSPDNGRIVLQIPPEYVAEIVDLLRSKLAIRNITCTRKNEFQSNVRDSFELSGEELGNQREED